MRQRHRVFLGEGPCDRLLGLLDTVDGVVHSQFVGFPLDYLGLPGESDLVGAAFVPISHTGRAAP